jgi:hypothetical protein
MKDETGKTADPSEIDDMQRLVSSGSPEDPLWKKGVAREKPCGRFTLTLGILAMYLHFLGLVVAWRCDAVSWNCPNYFEALMLFLLLGGLVLGVWVWIIGVREMRRMKNDITPNEQRGFAIAGMVLGIIIVGNYLLSAVAGITWWILSSVLPG